MSDAPKTVNLAHNGGLPNGNYPTSDLVEYTRTDLADALAAALRRIHDKRCEMDMGNLSADEAITEAADIARAALAAYEARKGGAA